MPRRLLILIALGTIVWIFFIPRSPVNSRLHRFELIGAIVVLWTCLALLCWQRKKIRYLLFAITIALPLLFLLPGRQIDRVELSKLYLRRLIDFDNTIYYWGGEGPRGIDCSGLPRRALRDALFSYGIRHVDGGALRMSIEQWWFDASAKALGEGYRNYTVSLNSRENIKTSIREMDYAELQPGDLAITRGGAHTLVYLGNNEWIQADPGLGKVAILNGRKDDNNWFGAPVTTHRWRVLADLQSE